MKYPKKVSKHIINWINTYLENSKINGLVVGVSGGIDSALTSTLCAETGKKLICIEMPIKQEDVQISRAKKHIEWLINFKKNTYYWKKHKQFKKYLLKDYLLKDYIKRVLDSP